MNLSPTLSLLLLFAICSQPLWAVDYKTDPTFNPVFTENDRVHDLVLLADGKLMIGGAVCGNTGTSSCTPMLRRLNADGSIDTSFNAILGKFPLFSSYIGTINLLPNGKYFVSGRLSVAGQPSNYALLNTDGSIDNSMALGFVGFSHNPKFQPTPDGKFIGCGERTINGQLYDVAYRMNADGTPDPTFRVTFTDGFCWDLQVLPDGKLLIEVGTDFGQTEVKQLNRLNSDGSKDLSFDADIQVGSGSDRLYAFTALADGKVLLTFWSSGQNDATLRRLSPNGSNDVTFPFCAGDVFLQQANGDLITNECKRWSGTYDRVDFARILPNGNIDTSLDNIFFDGRVYGIREAGTATYYTYGTFRSTQFNTSRRHLVRLMPDTTPPKAKFDFDGDGRSDLAVFRPSDRTWYINQSNDGFSYKLWGLATDAIAAGHFDGDGKTDIGVFRDGIMHAYSPVFSHRQIFIGQTGDKPILGNFEDYGTNLGDFIVRGVRSGAVKWFFRDGNGAGNPVGTALSLTLPGELASDNPVVGDFNGDSREEIGYFRNGQWYTSDYASFQVPQTTQWGIAGDIPVPGDYDGDRQTDYAIFRPSTGDWWVRRSTAGRFVIRFGQNGDIPVPADYDGDGKVDIAIYRNGQWWRYLSQTGSVTVDSWGSAGDIPIPAQAQF